MKIKSMTATFGKLGPGPSRAWSSLPKVAVMNLL